MEAQTRSNKICRMALAFLITFAIYNIGGFGSTDIILGVVFAGLYLLLGNLSVFSGDGGVPVPVAEYPVKINRSAMAVSALWTLSYVIYLGERIDRDLANPLFSGIYIILTISGLFAGLYLFLRKILYLLSSKIHASDPDGSFSFRIWLVYTGIIILCILPLFILNFPGTMTVDSYGQLVQAMGLEPYSDHHPWVHTMIIKTFYLLGYGVSGSVYGGIAAYTLFQMTVLAMAVAYSIERLREAGADRTARILLLFGFVLYPYNAAYAITMWKDILFAASVLVLTVTIYRMCCLRHKAGVADTVLLLISGAGMCLLRHNGFYAYILTMLVCLIYEFAVMRKRTTTGTGRRLLVCALSVVAAVLVIRGPVQSLFNVEKPDFAHNIPIPLQQIARVVYDGCELTDEETAAIERINTLDYLRTEYQPGGADPTMQWAVYGDSAYLEEHKGEYLGLWIRLGLKHPVEYIEAYIDSTRGYYTTMAPEQTEYYGLLPNNLGLEPRPLLGAGIRIKINELCSKLHSVIPVYGILYSMGACLLMLIFGVAVIKSQDRGRAGQTGDTDRIMGTRLLVYVPVAALTLTVLIASPLCADLRYAYSLMLSMPFLIYITLRG